MHLYIIIYWFIIFSEWSFLISFLFGFDCRGSVCLKRSTCCRIRESFRNSMTRSTVSRPISCEMLADSSPISCTLMPFLGRWSCFPFVVLILPVVGLRSDGNDIGPNFGYWDCISVEMVASGLFCCGQVLQCIKLNENDTTSSGRIFIRILFQELSEYMGLANLNGRLKDPWVLRGF